MFDFENLKVYQRAREIRKKIFSVLAKERLIDKLIIDQLKRAIISVILNVAEGTGKSSRLDKKRFFATARGSIYEVVAIIDILSDDGFISKEEKATLYSDLEVTSKMLAGLINSVK